MAKQIGAMPISGKIDNLVYYNTKNGGAVVRRAYPNLGKRVKTDKVYANTRRNNAEFGMCGYVASQLLSPILQRWKYILKPDAVGELTKELLALLPDDITSPWGERMLAKLDSRDLNTFNIILNKFSKNQISPEIVSLFTSNRIDIFSQGADYKYLIDDYNLLSAQEVNTLLTLGADGVNIYFGVYNLLLPYLYDPTKTVIKNPIVSVIDKLGSYELPTNGSELVSGSVSVFINKSLSPQDIDSESTRGISIYMIPTKQGVELVEFGSFYINGNVRIQE